MSEKLIAMSKWIVYISSTFIDLKEYRQTLKNLIENQLKGKFELHPKIMEWMHAYWGFSIIYVRLRKGRR